MAVKQEVILIDDSTPSPVRKIIVIDDSGSSPVRETAICHLRNRKDIKKYEEQEDCFILEFDPYNDLDALTLACPINDANADSDLIVVGERGKVACRDYPHSRHTCARYPFESTPHHTHCKLCYCYVCDSSAPCPKWTNHCHAFNNEAWNTEKHRNTKTV